MALNEGNNAIYLSIADGQIVRRFPAPTDKTTPRNTKHGKLVHECFYKSLEGKLASIEVRETEFNGKKIKTWNIGIKDGTDLYILQMDFSSGYATSFLKALPNVDVAKPITLSPKVTEVNGKKKTTLFINQDGAGVKWKFTKDNPNGLPPMVQVEFKGEKRWDDTAMMNFFVAMVETEIKPKLKNGTYVNVPAPPAYAGDLADFSTDGEDLPF